MEEETVESIVEEMLGHARGKASEAWYTPMRWVQLCDRLLKAHEREMEVERERRETEGWTK